MSSTEKDEQIGTAYERLEGALAPPPDHAERVQRRIDVRRRGRRVARTGLAAVVVVGVVGGVAYARSGDDPSGTVAVDQPSGPESTLVLTRSDGSTYAFPDVTVSCDPPADSDGPATGRIYALSPRHIEGDSPTEPFIYFEGIVKKIEDDQTFTFPNEWTMDSAHFPMVLFMADPEGSAKRGNEVASSAGGESGTVRVLEASCAPVPTLRLEVDMTLGSEVGQQPLDIAGSLG
jgi:hypothetical protein